MTKLHTCDYCNSRTEHVAVLWEGLDNEIFLCKDCLENAWKQIYEKENKVTQNTCTTENM